MSSPITITDLPFPPTVNMYWRHVVIRGQPRTLISREGRAYRDRVIDMLRPHGIETLAGRLQVSIRAWMPDRRRRDLDNLQKSLLDALAHAGVYEDDEQIDRLTIERAGIRRGGAVSVRIVSIPAEAQAVLAPDLKQSA